MRLVIADDAAEVRLLLGLCLPAYGDFDVVAEVGNGLEAVEAVRRLSPDVVLLDLSMPVMDGLTALQEIRKFDQRVKVVVLSGFEKANAASQALQAGANHYVEKGVDLDDLAEMLILYFGSSNLRP